MMNSRPRSVRRDERTPPRQLIIGDGSSVSAVSQTSDFFVQGPFGGFRSTARGHCPRANLTRDTSRDMEAQMSAAIALKLVYGEKTAKTAKTAVAPFLRCVTPGPIRPSGPGFFSR